MIHFLISIIIMMIPGLLIGGLYAVINPRNRERIFYGKRYLRENQEAWDEYCRNMTHQERRECFVGWVKQRQEETRHEYAWIPNCFHTEPTVCEIVIDGVRRRGTVKEISEHTGIPISLLEQVKYAEYLNTK